MKKVSVRHSLIDLLAFRGLVGNRKKRISRGSPQPQPVHPVNALAEQVHPTLLNLVVTAVRDESNTTRTYRLEPDVATGMSGLPHFRAGQYLSLKVDVDGTHITRPYSISSAPCEAMGAGGFYEIALKRVDNGFLTSWAWEHWREGSQIASSGPLGFFYHEPLRDAPTIIGLAGGSGITPFRSMAREIVHGSSLAANLLLLYGSSDEGDIPFVGEFRELEAKSAGRVRVVHVLSCEQVSMPDCEQGFVTAAIIQKHGDVAASSIFLCGPQAMYRFVDTELPKLGLPPKRIRREAFGEVKDITAVDGFLTERADKAYRLKVRIGNVETEIPAQGTETVLVAMERANLAPPSQCRSGECGFCRSLLLSGEVFVVPDSDGRRAADRELGFIHPCSSYPLSDLEVVAPRGV